MDVRNIILKILEHKVEIHRFTEPLFHFRNIMTRLEKWVYKNILWNAPSLCFFSYFYPLCLLFKGKQVSISKWTYAQLDFYEA